MSIQEKATKYEGRFYASIADNDYQRDCRKSPQADSWGRCRKNDLTECAIINDLIIMKGHETPKNQALTILKGFSTVSGFIHYVVCAAISGLKLLEGLGGVVV